MRTWCDTHPWERIPCPRCAALEQAAQGDRDGETFDRERDGVRLGAQMRRVFEAMFDGDWWTLADLAEWTGDPEGSVAARIRDLRKEKFGGHTVERKHVRKGLWKYRLVHKERTA